MRTEATQVCSRQVQTRGMSNFFGLVHLDNRLGGSPVAPSTSTPSAAVQPSPEGSTKAPQRSQLS
jgi:hypothetical protein